jgi:hypothetical protein
MQAEEGRAARHIRSAATPVGVTATANETRDVRLIRPRQKRSLAPLPRLANASGFRVAWESWLLLAESIRDEFLPVRQGERA